MIDYSKYNLAEMQAIVTVLDDLTDEMSVVQGFEQDFEMALSEFLRASNRAKVLIDQQARDHAAAEAEKVDRIKQACVAGAPPAVKCCNIDRCGVCLTDCPYTDEPIPAGADEPAEDPAGLRDMQSLVDGLRWCAARLAALADAEDEHFAECSRTDVCNKVILLRNCNRGVTEMLSDIRNHYDGLH